MQIFTVCLLYEMNKRKSSWWYPYLMELPRSYDTLACWGHFETEALQVCFPTYDFFVLLSQIQILYSKNEGSEKILKYLI